MLHVVVIRPMELVSILKYMKIGIGKFYDGSKFFR